jgi:hypothetical protein
MYNNMPTEEINRIVTNILSTNNTCPAIYKQAWCGGFRGASVSKAICAYTLLTAEK